GALGVGLGVTLWLSTDTAERSYELGRARQVNQALLQQKEGLERDVLEAQAAPALAEAARNLGMIPSRDTAHLVQDASGNWMVVGTPKPAQGVQPPPLNSPLPEPGPPVPPPPPAPRVVDPREVAVHVPQRTAPLPNPEIAVPATAPAAAPGPAPAALPVPVAPAPAAPLDAAAPHLDTPQAPTLPGPPPVVVDQAPAPVPGPAA
ncbi:MAG: domain containing protein, partial [Mycobacterium sp.]|nr:domain containing protein [Mycobacterium sp.]